MYKAACTILFICFSHFYCLAQIGAQESDASAVLNLDSSTQGFLPPRMTKAQRDAIVNPAEGLFLYSLDDKCFQYYDGTQWTECLRPTPLNSLDCTSTNTTGSYAAGTPLNATNTLTINVIVNTIEPYTISTDTVNGYSFSGTGTFNNIGTNTITLTGSGTPTAIQTDTFTITYAGKNDICSTNITTTDVLPNCLAYYNAGQTTDGIYNVDPDGSGPILAYDCYCNMTDDGGGWTLVFNHNVAGGYWVNDAEANEFNVNSPGLTTNKYSILSKLDEIKSSAEYEFRLFYPSLNKRNHWSQTFDPRTSGSATRPVAGYAPINIEMSESQWGGIELSGGSTYLDGSVMSGSWYYSIGSADAWNGSMPANNVPSDIVQLYVR